MGTKIDPFPANNAHSNETRETMEKSHLKNTSEIESKEKDLKIEELKQQIADLKAKNEQLHKVESQYNQIMKCIDTKNGFLLQNAIPIMPDIDYFSSGKSSTDKSTKEMNGDLSSKEINHILEDVDGDNVSTP